MFLVKLQTKQRHYYTVEGNANMVYFGLQTTLEQLFMLIFFLLYFENLTVIYQIQYLN